MKNILTVSVILILFTTSIVHANGTATGQIKKILTMTDGAGQIVLVVDAPHNNKPSCQLTGYDSNFRINPTTDSGKALYSMALAAAATGKSISVQGTGACDLHQDNEDVRYISIEY